MRTYEEIFGLDKTAALRAFEQAANDAKTIVEQKHFHELKEEHIFALLNYRKYAQNVSDEPFVTFSQGLIDRLYRYAVEETDEAILTILKTRNMTYSLNALDATYSEIYKDCYANSKTQDPHLEFMIKHDLTPSKNTIEQVFFAITNIRDDTKRGALLNLFFNNNVYTISEAGVFNALEGALQSKGDVKFQQLNSMLVLQPQDESLYASVFKEAIKYNKPEVMLLLTSEEAKNAVQKNLLFETELQTREDGQHLALPGLLRMVVNRQSDNPDGMMGVASWQCFRTVIQTHLDEFPEESRPILTALSDSVEHLFPLCTSSDKAVAQQAQNCMNALQNVAKDLLSAKPEEIKNCINNHQRVVGETFETAYTTLARSKAHHYALNALTAAISLIVPIGLIIGAVSVYHKYKHGTFDLFATTHAQQKIEDSAGKLRDKLTEIKGDEDPKEPEKGAQLNQ